MDFNIGIYAVFEIFGFPVYITESLVNMWIVMAILIAFAIVVRLKLTYTTSPKGLQNVAELIVESFDRFVRGAAGDKVAYLGYWYFAVFSFILLSNIGGVFFRPPTADWAVTFPLALVTLVLIHVLALKHKPKEHLKDMVVQPFPYLYPINLVLNLIGEIARPISLSFRLFGNILGSMVLLSLVYNVAPIPARIIFPALLHGYFDVAMGALQAFVFTVLGLSFIGAIAGTSE